MMKLTAAAFLVTTLLLSQAGAQETDCASSHGQKSCDPMPKALDDDLSLYDKILQSGNNGKKTKGPPCVVKKLCPSACADYRFTPTEGDPAAPTKGEKGYKYASYLDGNDESSVGAKFITQILKNPALDAAIRADSKTRNQVLKDPRLKLAFECDPNYRKIIENGPTLHFLYSEPSGNEFTIGAHSARVINLYEQQKKFFDLEHVNWPPGFRVAQLDRFMHTMLALHDIGKSIAFRTGDKSLQAEFNGPYMTTLMKALGFNDVEISVAHALEQNDDTIGSFLRGQLQRKDALAKFEEWAGHARIEPRQFFKLQSAYFSVDAGSYPMLHARAFSTKKEGRLVPSDFSYKMLASEYRDPAEPMPVGGSAAEAEYGFGPLWDGKPDSTGALVVSSVVSPKHTVRPLFAGEDFKNAVSALAADGPLRFDPALKAILEAGASNQFVLGLPIHPARNLEQPPTSGQLASGASDRYEALKSSFDARSSVSLGLDSRSYDVAGLLGYAVMAKSLSRTMQNWVGVKYDHSAFDSGRILRESLRANGYPDAAARFAESLTKIEVLDEVFRSKVIKGGDPMISKAVLQSFRDRIAYQAEQSGLTGPGAEREYFKMLSAAYFSTLPEDPKKPSATEDKGFQNLARLILTGK